VEFVSGLPVKVEVTDSAAAIEALLPEVCAMVGKGLVELQDTTVVSFATGETRTR
jgi:PII-like signaling protein